MNSVCFENRYSGPILKSFLVANNIFEENLGENHKIIFIDDDLLNKIKKIVMSNFYELKKIGEVEYEIYFPYTFFNYNYHR